MVRQCLLECLPQQRHAVGSLLSALLQEPLLSGLGAFAGRTDGIESHSFDVAPNGGEWDPTVGGTG